MEALSLSPRELSREDVVAGIGGALLGHVLIFAMVLIVPSLMPKKKFEMPFATVNLVSMQEFGAGAPASKKGVAAPAKTSEGSKSQEARKSSSSTGAAKSEPLVPVKRLRMEEPTTRHEPELKRIEAREAPKIQNRSQTAASVEKDLDKLIAKPKAAPKPAPITQQASSSGDDDERRTASRESGVKNAQTASAAASGSDQKGAKGGAAGPQGSPKGTAEGTARGNSEGVAKGTGTGSAAGGTPDGAAVASARTAYYTMIQNIIKRNWSIPDFLRTQKLQAHVVLVVRKDGKVLNVQIEKGSGQPLFDQSVESAVRKSDPLPPFPEVYSPAKEEIGLRFRPEDLS